MSKSDLSLRLTRYWLLSRGLQSGQLKLPAKILLVKQDADDKGESSSSWLDVDIEKFFFKVSESVPEEIFDGV